LGAWGRCKDQKLIVSGPGSGALAQSRERLDLRRDTLQGHSTLSCSYEPATTVTWTWRSTVRLGVPCTVGAGRKHAAVPDCPGPSRNLPDTASGQAVRRRPGALVPGAGLSPLSRMRHPRPRRRTGLVRGVRTRSSDRLLLQRARGVSIVQCTAHGAGDGTPCRSGLPAGAGAPLGARHLRGESSPHRGRSRGPGHPPHLGPDPGAAASPAPLGTPAGPSSLHSIPATWEMAQDPNCFGYRVPASDQPLACAPVPEACPLAIWCRFW
jgi:hypothetical protein